MTKQTTVVDVSSFTTDAKFRTWGLAQSTAMQACRLVKTSDTGQINWATVTKPTATNTKAGYEIYRFDDTLQSTRPIFLRIDYGSGGTASGNSPATWITVGTSTDGAGVITGLALPVLQSFNVSATISNTVMAGMFTHTTDGYALLNFGMNLTASNITSGNAGFYMLDRTRDDDGDPTGEGVNLWVVRTPPATVAHGLYGLNFDTVAVYSASQRYPLISLPNTTYSLATGDSVPLSRSYGFVGHLVPSMANVGYYTSDITALSTFTATPFGATPRTYFAFGGHGHSVGFEGTGGSGSATSVQLAALWED